MGRSEDDAIEGTLRGPIRKIVNGVIARECDRRATGCRQLASERGKQQPRRSHVDRVVTVKTLDGRGEQPGVDSLAVRHDERVEGTQPGDRLSDQRLGSGGVGEVDRNEVHAASEVAQFLG
jgi:hypothetical protein